MFKTLPLIVVIALVALTLLIGVSPASAAPTPIDTNTFLGGTISTGSTYSWFPSYSSSANSDSSRNVSGNFGLQIDGNNATLSSAYWNFNYYGPNNSQWEARCDLYGYVGTVSALSSQYWSQQYSPQGSTNISESLSYRCYSPYTDTLNSLNSQLAWLGRYLADNPNDPNRLQIQIEMLQIQLQILSLQPNNDRVLSVNGNFNISDSTLDWSNFRYSTGTTDWYTYPNGYDNPPVITEVPTWQAEYYVTGTTVPEPTTLAFLAIGGLAFAGRIIRRRRIA